MALNRRNLLVGLGGIVAGGGALVGTGAFTTVQAERTVEVETAGDANAFLRLEPTDDPNGDPNNDNDPNGEGYAYIEDNVLKVNIPDVNLDAVTHIDNVFQVTNNGTQPIVLYFEERNGNDNPSGDAVDAGVKTDQLHADSVGENDQPTSNGIYDEDVVDASAPSSPDDSTYDNLGVKLDSGEALKVGFYIDTSDDNLNTGLDDDDSESSNVGAPETLLNSLVIYASADQVNNNNYQFVEVNSAQ